MQIHIGSRYLQRFITRTENVSISGITKVGEIVQRENRCLESVAKMTVKELAKKLKKCRDDSEVIIVGINDSCIEFRQVYGCVVEDTGEALILMKRKEREKDGKDND